MIHIRSRYYLCINDQWIPLQTHTKIRLCVCVCWGLLRGCGGLGSQMSVNPSRVYPLLFQLYYFLIQIRSLCNETIWDVITIKWSQVFWKHQHNYNFSLNDRHSRGAPLALNYSKAYETSAWLENGCICGSFLHLEVSNPWTDICAHKVADAV